MTTLSLTGLTKAYPQADQAAVHGLTFSVASGSLTALLGPSGSGKTTTMKLIAGHLSPDAGEIALDGQPISALPPERRGIAMVFQAPLLFPHLTVAGNIGFGLRMRGEAPAQIASQVQQQRAALGRALILQPRVLLLDEPLSNLDPTLRDEMRTLIRSLQRETGITTLVITHDQAEAVALADCVALLLDGRIAQYTPPEEFYRRPASAAVARFFGGVNFIPGTARGGQFHSPLGPLTLPPAAPEGDRILTVRPEALRLGPGENSRENSRPARVTALTFLGTQTRVDLSVNGTALSALTTPFAAQGLSPGDEITLSLPPDALWLLPRSV